MSGVARVGIDAAGGVILGGRQNFVYCNGALVSVVGDAVAGHGPGVHAGPTMAQGSSSVFINGIPVCRQGDLATCGDAATPGSSNTFVGG